MFRFLSLALFCARINLSFLLAISIFLLPRCVHTQLLRTAHVKENFYITRRNLFIYCPSVTNFKVASGYITFKSLERCYSDNFLFATKHSLCKRHESTNVTIKPVTRLFTPRRFTSVDHRISCLIGLIFISNLLHRL